MPKGHNLENIGTLGFPGGVGSEGLETILELKDVTKSFGQEKVLRGLNLAVQKGEFITLLGPSGCGKTTTLRIIAGLEAPDVGSVFIAGKDVTFKEPNERNVNMVFQNYALFPHMSVESNVGYSLRLKRAGKDVIEKTVSWALGLVQLKGFEKRFPGELSGGQKQRVAIARAIVNEPALLLLDEPLGALDLQLRRQMQIELKRLQKRLGITFVYITHDQEEALNMSDRIAVMRDGDFEQIGAPSEVYDLPKTSYVASFVGSANIFKGNVAGVEGEVIYFKNGNGIGCAQLRCGTVEVGQAVTVAVRSEFLETMSKEPRGCGFKAVVKEKTFAGGLLRIGLILSDGQEIISSRHGIDSDSNPGDEVWAAWAPNRGILVDLGEKA